MRKHTTKKLLQLLAGIALSTFARTAPAQPQIVLSNGELPMTRLVVGEHLVAQLKAGVPGQVYDFVLRSSDGAEIARATAEADAAGAAGPVLLWAYSGVVGCDPGAAADPDRLRFRFFAEAEEALAGRELVVEVLGGLRKRELRQVLPVFAGDQELPYFSGADGCLRRFFRAAEPVYLSLFHPYQSAESRQVFLVRARPQGLPIGQALEDVRGAGSLERIDPGGDLATVLIWGAVETLGDEFASALEFNGVVRTQPSAARARLATDRVIAVPGRIDVDGGGISITIDGCPKCRLSTPAPPPPPQ